MVQCLPKVQKSLVPSSAPHTNKKRKNTEKNALSWLGDTEVDELQVQGLPRLYRKFKVSLGNSVKQLSLKTKGKRKRWQEGLPV